MFSPVKPFFYHHIQYPPCIIIQGSSFVSNFPATTKTTLTHTNISVNYYYYFHKNRQPFFIAAYLSITSLCQCRRIFYPPLAPLFLHNLQFNQSTAPIIPLMHAHVWLRHEPSHELYHGLHQGYFS